MDRVVKESDGTPEKTADDFSDDQAQRGKHRPPEDRGLQGRMRMRVRMTVAMMRVSGKAVAVLVRGFGGIARRRCRSLRLRVHQGNSLTPPNGPMQRRLRLITQFDTSPTRFR